MRWKEVRKCVNWAIKRVTRTRVLCSFITKTWRNLKLRYELKVPMAVPSFESSWVGRGNKRVNLWDKLKTMLRVIRLPGCSDIKELFDG